MLLRCYYNGLPAGEQRRFRVRNGRICLTAGLGLNSLAYVTGRFAPASLSVVSDFFAGGMCGLAIVLLGTSIVLNRPWTSR